MLIFRDDFMTWTHFQHYKPFDRANVLVTSGFLITSRLEMDRNLHSTLYNGNNYLSMLRWKLTHVSKSGSRATRKIHCIKPQWNTIPRESCVYFVGYTVYAEYHGCLCSSGIILGMGTAKEIKRYYVTPFLIGWAHSQNYLCLSVNILLVYIGSWMSYIETIYVVKRSTYFNASFSIMYFGLFFQTICI